LFSHQQILPVRAQTACNKKREQMKLQLKQTGELDVSYSTSWKLI
jgi:hypothetical protein